MNNYLGNADHFTHTATGAKSAGALVVVGGLVGVAHDTYATGDTMVCYANILARLAKPTGVVFAKGAPVYCTSAGVLTATATGNQLAGIAAAAATSGASKTTADVYIKPLGAPSVADV